MDLIADILLGAGAFGAAIYCMVLSRRLQRLTRLESGMGGAIAVLSAQVDDLTRTLGRAESAAKSSSDRLEAQTRRAEAAVKRLEILLATLNDLPQAPAGPKPAPAPSAPEGHRDTALAADTVTVAAPVTPPAPPPEPAAVARPLAPRGRVVQRRRSRRELEDVA